MVYVPGNKQATADTLSRKKSLAVLASLSECTMENIDMEDMLHTEVAVSLIEVLVAASDQDQEDGVQGVRVLGIDAEHTVSNGWKFRKPLMKTKCS